MVRSFSLLVCLVALVAAVPPRQPKLIWEDNFDNLDQNRWHHLVTAWGGGNGEFVYYRNVRKNSWVSGGTLKIKPTLTSAEKTDDEIRYGTIYDPTCNMEPCVSQSGPDSVKPVFSARLHTQGTFHVKYSKVQVRAKIPRGDWLWPAIWMMPEADHYGQWPRSGEIDIMESRGNINLHDAGGNSVGVDVIGSTMHWGPNENQNGWPHTHWERKINKGDFSDEFHIYEVERTPTSMTFRVNGNEYGKITPPKGGFWELGGFGGKNIWSDGERMAPFDKPFYIILNVAVGGGYFDDSFVGKPPRPWQWQSGHPMLQFYEAQHKWHPTWDRPEMEVDWVRVYEL